MLPSLQPSMVQGQLEEDRKRSFILGQALGSELEQRLLENLIKGSSVKVGGVFVCCAVVAQRLHAHTKAGGGQALPGHASAWGEGNLVVLVASLLDQECYTLSKASLPSCLGLFLSTGGHIVHDTGVCCALLRAG